MRKRIDSVSINPNGEPINASRYYFRLGSNDYEYHVMRGHCSCRILKEKIDWDLVCYPLDSKNSFGKKHGEFEATHIFTKTYSQWTTKPTQPEQYCFPLSIELTLPQVNLSQNVYIPSTIVDSTMFRLPPICPVYTSCK
ncbi:predicted protein [Naegleria gruberi]|uniref:Predicted protein n=1 Tax=Naegleria gruberi TaxID=5762 RepID=D2V351_NAEGR|nr:uncharacterized protein NAEGRDRAFT_63229 [Naegleria gruberi]EFC48715.1 predicted protein [Naegleria gruberi]|eukprot:XP_002681459.1 predicted protein [Naegleria gruberi strain NEG-M]